MFTDITYQDWLAEQNKPKMIKRVIDDYRRCEAFKSALEAMEYFQSNNPPVGEKVALRLDKLEKKDPTTGLVKTGAVQTPVEGTQVPHGFFSLFVVQENQHLLGNGVTLSDEAQKQRLGIGFDTALSALGEKALIQGVSYGFWNVDHLEVLPAAVDKQSGCVALLDEMTGEPGAAIQFWRLNDSKPLYARTFETDGWTLYREEKDGLKPMEGRTAYRRDILVDGFGQQVVGTRNYGVLPIFPLYANPEKTSELKRGIKKKIDLYDSIMSDFGDNLERTNDIYWVINNFGGTSEDIIGMLAEISRIKATYTEASAGGQATAEPHTIEVPYQARKTALDLLHRALYEEAMALDMDALTGGSLTNVAIKTAMTNLNLKCDRFEWQCFAFVQRLLGLLGIETEKIAFNRRSIANDSEIVNDIYTMRTDLDRETALKLNPYISQDDIPGILENLAAEENTGVMSMNELQRQMDAMREAEALNEPGQG